MVDHFADIDAPDLTDVPPMSQPYPLRNVLRDDIVVDGLDRDEVLAAAPEGRTTASASPRSSGSSREPEHRRHRQ